MKGVLSIFDRALRAIAMIAIKFYQFALSPLKTCLFGAFCRCRFETTCSRYAINAYWNHNFLMATFLVAKRLIKCQPFHRNFVE
jgi:putative membrane protein insertion efficiency factor